MKSNPLFDAAQEALSSIRDNVPNLGAPPGATPISWPDQAAQFIGVLPDLLKGGPQAREIERLHGPGAVEQYIDHMTKEIAKGRQRRGRA
jgi:hypothetical protein